MFWRSDSACVATDEMVVADFNLDAQSVTENPCIREAGFKPFPNWLSKDEAPETLEGLN
jgi:hypothetical protein